MNNKIVVVGVCCCLLSGCLVNNPTNGGVSMSGSSNSMNSMLNTAMQLGGQNIAQHTGMNVGQQRQLMEAMTSHAQPQSGQPQEIVVAQSNYRGGNSTNLDDLAQRARLAGREAHKLEVRSQQKKSLSPAMQAELKAQSRAKLAEQKALLEEYHQQRRSNQQKASQQQQVQRNAAAEKERLRRANLTPEQRAAEDKAKMNALGTMIGVMGMAGSMGDGRGDGSVDCTQNPNHLDCTGVPDSSSPAPQSNAPAPTSSGFYGNCHGGAAYGC